MVVFSSHYHNIICYDYQVLYVTKTFIQFSLEYISCQCNTEGHYCKSVSAYLSIESCEIGEDFIQFFMPIPFFCSHTQLYASICKHVGNVFQCVKMVGFSGHRFIEIGWIKAYSLFFSCPWLFLLSTRTKLLMHSVASVMGISTLACSILLISCWKASLR